MKFDAGLFEYYTKPFAVAPGWNLPTPFGAFASHEEALAWFRGQGDVNVVTVSVMLPHDHTRAWPVEIYRSQHFKIVSRYGKQLFENSAVAA